MIEPPNNQPFYEHYQGETVMSRPWWAWCAVVSDLVATLPPPPLREQVIVGPRVIAKPWRLWFQNLGTLQSVSEAPFQEPFLHGEYVSDVWQKWFSLVASA
jgi:hypothetical protein